MATLQKIRNRGPLLLIVIGLALLAFILGDLWKITQPSGVVSVGSINGKSVDAQLYQDEVERYAQVLRFSSGTQSLTDAEYAAVKDQVWNTMVRKGLLEKETEAIGLKVTDAELQSVIESGNSSLLQNTPFSNEVTGRFDVDYLRAFLSAYEDMDRATMAAEYVDYYDNLYNFWMYIEDNLRFDLLATKYMAIVEAAMVSNPVSQRNSYENRVKRSDVLLAALPYSLVPDSLARVTKADVKSLYNEKREMFYQIAESRDLLYIDYEILPSKADREALAAEVDNLSEQFRDIDSDYAAFLRMAASSESYSEVAKSIDALPQDVADRLDSVKLGEMFGPYYNLSDDSYNAFKLLNIENSYDSISFAQIQVAAESDEERSRLADSLLNAIKLGADMAELAQKYGQNGEAQWLVSSDYDMGSYTGDNALYLNTINLMKRGEVKRIDVTGGSIIIKVFDQKNRVKKYNVAILKREVEFSDETSDLAYNRLSQFVASNMQIDSLKANAENAGFRLLNAPSTSSSSYYVGSVMNSHDALRWAFESKAGEISRIYEVGESNNHLLVVAVDAINKKGYRPVDALVTTLQYDAIKAKKAEILKKRFAGVEDIASALKMEGVKYDTVRYVNFTTPAYIGITFANEPNIGAAVMDLKREVLSKPIVGEGGVYVAQKVGPDGYAIEFDAEAEASRLEAMDVSAMQSRIMQQLYFDADVIDNRYKLF